MDKHEPKLTNILTKTYLLMEKRNHMRRIGEINHLTNLEEFRNSQKQTQTNETHTLGFMQQKFMKVKDEYVNVRAALGLQNTLKSHSNTRGSIIKGLGWIFYRKDRYFPMEDQSSRLATNLEVLPGLRNHTAPFQLDFN